MVSLEVLTGSFEKLWPSSSADNWDQPGLAFGSKKAQVSKVLLTVDVTAAVLREAIELGAQLVISHHPPLLRGVNELGSETVKGNIAKLAIGNDIAIYAAHTNADKAVNGSATALVRALGGANHSALDPETGHGAVFDLPKAESLVSLATRLAKSLPAVAAGLKVAGDPNREVKKIAVAPGAGDSFMQQAIGAEADVFITSDLRHHPAQDFMELNEVGMQISLIDISHWAAESLWLPLAKKELEALHPDVQFLISELRTDPWDFAVMQ